ncbi:MAG: amino acid adenylation domain-containing protein [Anaerolineales bacterium]|nr:amino acid adenylation domain-containing protein [Anaerolineales bacterium]
MTETPTLAGLFQAQAKANPDSLAVVAGTKSIHYGELYQQAEIIACQLLQQGLQPETLVGLAVERSIEMIAGLFGVLLAGGAYIPLSPSLPPTRLDQMIQDARLEWALVNNHVPWNSQVAHTIAISSLSAQTPEITLPTIQPEQLAYVLYTSGSTGKPKGVMIEHRNVVAHLAGIEQVAPRRLPLIGTQVAPYTFDASVWEIFSNLCYGGALHIIQRPEDVPALAQYLLDQRVNSSFLPPGILDDLGERLGRRASEVRLDRLMVGVETIPQRTLQRLLDLNPEMRIINGYGPTEAVVCATYYIFKPTTTPNAPTPIGQALPGYKINLVDSQLQPVPPGEMGEILIGGAGVGRGYLNDPLLTQARFIADPFNGQTAGRAYRTGDYARPLPDGNLEFIGRMDNQVKIRGYRVETGDVEAAILEHPGVKSAVVTAMPDPAGMKRLVAYIIYDPTQPPALSADLRNFLAERLPDYMIPSLVAPVAQIPRTTHGKVNFSALPAPDWSQRRLDTPVIPPRSQAEKRLANAWTQVLGINEISVDDNFFDLGGDSLLAVRLVAAIEQAFGFIPPISTVFESPSLAELAGRLERWQTTQESSKAIQSGGDRKAPLSSSQQRLWFLAQLEPNRPAYHNPLALRLNGDLNVAALQTSLNTIVSRHAILRTTFLNDHGIPYQIIADRLEIDLPLVDLSDISQDDRQEQLWERLNALVQEPFNLERGPLIRAALFHLGGQEHILLVNLHHLVFDAWSIGLFLQELQCAYAAGVGISPAEQLPDLPIQYADYAAWEQRGGQEAVFQKQLEHWKRRLGLFTEADQPITLPRLNLPTDHPRLDARLHSGEGQVRLVRLDSELLEKLNSLAQQTNTTLFMVMYAAFVALLYRYTGQEDILVGSYLANRNLPETQDLIGSFINPVVLRARCSGDWSFGELLQHIRQVALDAYDNQEMPLEILIQTLTLEQDSSFRSLFEVAFNFVNTPLSTLNFPGIGAEELSLENEDKVYDMHVEDLLLDIFPDSLKTNGARGMLIKFQYKTALFKAETIHRMIAHFLTLLESIVENPASRLMALQLLNKVEDQQILSVWNATRRGYPNHLCYHQLFEEQVRKTPQAAAASFEDQVLTFIELNQRANQLAHYLRGLGVGPGKIVGVYTERRLEMLVSMLGILKAGGAYLPLDPSYPVERLEYMLQDSGAGFVVTQASLADRLPANGYQLVRLDGNLSTAAEQAAIEGQSWENPANITSPGDPVYVIYTSGSTGKPKGVRVSHRGLVNHNFAVGESYALRADDRVLQFASPGFDVTAEEIFPTWLYGGCVVLCPAWQALNPADFSPFVEREKLTILNLPGSFWQAWIDEMQRAPQPLPGCLRLVVVGSEQVLVSDLEAWLQLTSRSPGLHWMNAYGASETTITSTLFELAEGCPSFPGYTVPIGRPIANTLAYILDANLQPVPVGVPGELYIGGAGVALGYLNLPEYNLEKFIPNPFASQVGEAQVDNRLYRTGDLARYLSDGNIEFLGRLDNQVKLRGYRIELGEIESVLAAHPQVRQAAVIAAWTNGPDDKPSDDKRLLAYVAPHPGATLQAGELRAHLKSRLPDYMLPAVYIILESLPLLPGGKIDRRALPAPQAPGPDAREDYIPPRTPLEQTLAQIWQEVLRRDKIGLEDNFFELGGHSLLAARLLSEVSRQLGLHIPLIELFENPTIAQLAASLESLNRDELQLEAHPAFEPIQATRPEQGPLPASYGEFRMWLVSLLEPNNPSYNISFALHIRGPLQPDLLEASLNLLVERHEILRTTFPAPEMRPVRVIADSLTLSLPVEDLSYLAGEEQRQELEQRLKLEANQLFNIAAGPLLRMKLFRLGEEQHVLLGCVLHMVFDAWSKDILLEELWACYTALEKGKQPELPEIPLQLADYALWQQSETYNQRVEEQLQYWQEQLSGEWPRLQLPPDHPRPAKASERGATLSLEIPTATLEGLRGLSQRQHSTLYITLLAAFDALLYQYTGQEDLLIWSFLTNRNRPETQRMIGMLINYTVLRTRLKGDLSFAELLQRVRETALGAYNHPDVPLEKLLSSFWNQIDLLDYRALFTVVFNFINLAHDPLSVPGLEIEDYPFDPETSTFDLYVEIVERPDSLLCVFRYTPELYEPETIRRAMLAYRRLLEAVVADPQQRLDQLHLTNHG